MNLLKGLRKSGIFKILKIFTSPKKKFSDIFTHGSFFDIFSFPKQKYLEYWGKNLTFIRIIKNNRSCKDKVHDQIMISENRLKVHESKLSKLKWTFNGCLLSKLYCITYAAYANNKDCVIKLWRQKEPKESLVMIVLMICY